MGRLITTTISFNNNKKIEGTLPGPSSLLSSSLDNQRFWWHKCTPHRKNKPKKQGTPQSPPLAKKGSTPPPYKMEAFSCSPVTPSRALMSPSMAFGGFGGTSPASLAASTPPTGGGLHRPVPPPFAAAPAAASQSQASSGQRASAGAVHAEGGLRAASLAFSPSSTATGSSSSASASPQSASSSGDAASPPSASEDDDSSSMPQFSPPPCLDVAAAEAAAMAVEASRAREAEYLSAAGGDRSSSASASAPPSHAASSSAAALSASPGRSFSGSGSTAAAAAAAREGSATYYNTHSRSVSLDGVRRAASVASADRLFVEHDRGVVFNGAAVAVRDAETAEEEVVEEEGYEAARRAALRAASASASLSPDLRRQQQPRAQPVGSTQHQQHTSVLNLCPGGERDDMDGDGDGVRHENDSDDADAGLLGAERRLASLRRTREEHAGLLSDMMSAAAAEAPQQQQPTAAAAADSAAAADTLRADLHSARSEAAALRAEVAAVRAEAAAAVDERFRAHQATVEAQLEEAAAAQQEMIARAVAHVNARHADEAQQRVQAALEHAQRGFAAKATSLSIQLDAVKKQVQATTDASDQLHADVMSEVRAALVAAAAAAAPPPPPPPAPPQQAHPATAALSPPRFPDEAVLEVAKRVSLHVEEVMEARLQEVVEERVAEALRTRDAADAEKRQKEEEDEGRGGVDVEAFAAVAREVAGVSERLRELERLSERQALLGAASVAPAAAAAAPAPTLATKAELREQSGWLLAEVQASLAAHEKGFEVRAAGVAAEAVAAASAAAVAAAAAAAATAQRVEAAAAAAEGAKTAQASLGERMHQQHRVLWGRLKALEAAVGTAAPTETVAAASGTSARQPPQPVAAVAASTAAPAAPLPPREEDGGGARIMGRLGELEKRLGSVLSQRARSGSGVKRTTEPAAAGPMHEQELSTSVRASWEEYQQVRRDVFVAETGAKGEKASPPPQTPRSEWGGSMLSFGLSPATATPQTAIKGAAQARAAAAAAGVPGGAAAERVESPSISSIDADESAGLNALQPWWHDTIHN